MPGKPKQEFFKALIKVHLNLLMSSLQHPFFGHLLGLFWLPRPNYRGINYRGIFSGNLVVTGMAMARISVRSLTEKVKEK